MWDPRGTGFWPPTTLTMEILKLAWISMTFSGPELADRFQPIVSSSSQGALLSNPTVCISHTDQADPQLFRQEPLWQATLTLLAFGATLRRIAIPSPTQNVRRTVSLFSAASSPRTQLPTQPTTRC